MASKIENLIEEIAGLSVDQLAELVKSLESRFNVSAAMPMAMAASVAAPSEAPAAAEEKSEYKVELIDGGADKIKAIKALRQVTTLGLTEAKKAVEEVPTVIAAAASKEDAKKMKATLEEAGAKVKLS